MPDWWGNWGQVIGTPANAQAELLQQQFLLQQWAHYQAARQRAEAAKELDEEGDMINNFRVGCDPEFMLLDGKGATVLASAHFPHLGPIGYDHNGRVAEFRPDPVKGVYSMVKSIQKLVKSPMIINANRRLRAGAYCNNDCLGGHVHFGFNAFEEKPPNGFGIWNGGKLNARGAQVTKALDSLTKALEHLDILPASESGKRRASAQGQGNHYGEYGDVRDCNGHMEYRTMASWLHDPKVTFLCLTAAKLAAADPEGSFATLKSVDSFKKLGDWIENYKEKDLNAKRVVEKLVGAGHKKLQVDPTVDFRERWEELGV